MTRRISIVGLGKLGASMAAAIAGQGHEVWGVDVDPAAVDALKAGRAPVQETGLEDLIMANRARLHGTMSHEQAIRETELTFVVVPTPSDARGAFSLQYAAAAFTAIGLAIRAKAAPHSVVLTSTVLPGAMRYGLLPILERHAGRSAGPDLRVCYSPEFIALGTVIRDFLNPDFVLIGEFDRASGDHLEACYRDIIAQAPIQRMTFENAELAKIAVNAFVTSKITFANMLADLCARIPGGDVDVVSRAIGLDTRIGRKYLIGGLGFGGPCFPRDNTALSFIAETLGACSDLPVAVEQINRSSAERILTQLAPQLSRGGTVAVLGLAYKPLSNVIEESQAMVLVKAFLTRGIRVVAYDPLAGPAADRELGGRALIVDSARRCVRGASVVLIATPDPEFQSLTAGDFIVDGGRPLVVDFWRILGDRLANQPQIDYWPYGCGDSTAGASVLQQLWSS
jgi:UDPglucose 6-dehydrogenase